ncbi:MAG TPA: LnmK family bifunctional acyltransferase/decarboxylase [Caulobacteraceae bacterium]|jgi:probable biosynthetic protein (TIGR04098 family)|nr:LnmK family bifunctional acyltransferase/decarboxylase [Caulobacteraceae bacterium]
MKLNGMVDRLLVAISRDVSTDQLLRRRFKRLYDVDVGRHTFWRFNSEQISSGARIGRYCSIPSSARVVDENHPLAALSTHPLFYLRDWGLVSDNQLRPSPTVIEDDVWMGHASILTPGCKWVGRGAVIGAGAVVMRDVPPYAVMMGVPAQLVRFRFSPELIDAIEATRWWELDPAELKEATRDDPAFLTSPTVEAARRFARRRGLAETATPERKAADLGLGIGEPQLIETFRREKPDFTAAMLDMPIAELGIDSFGLINLRLALEQQSGQRISDTDWGSMTAARDLLTVSAVSAVGASDAGPAPARVGDCSTELVGGNAELRRFSLTLPRMAMSGLSESWLLKECAAMHWSNITSGLGKPTHEIADDTGHRLYATVTRLWIDSTVPLSAFCENEVFAVQLGTTRMGAAMFFGDGDLTGESGRIRLGLMTSFARLGEHGANTSLLKGQPFIPESCAIPALDEMPPLVAEYRAIRAERDSEPLFSVEYEVQPPHDINGVGLLYFATYPIIADLCASKYGGMRSITDFATVKRDISYFANADPSETLVYNLLRWEESADALETEASLARKSDGTRMARITTRKQRIAD